MKSSELVNISGDEKNLSILNKWKLKAVSALFLNLHIIAINWLSGCWGSEFIVVRVQSSKDP